MSTLDARQEAAHRRVVRVGIASGVALAVMLATLSILAAAFAHDHDAAVRELGEATRFHRSLDEVLQLVVDGETAERGYVLTGDPVFLAPLDHTRRALPDVLDSVVRLLSARHGEGLAERLEDAVRARMAFTEETVAQVDEGHRERAVAAIAGGLGRTRMDAVRAIVDEAHEREEDGVSSLLLQVESSRTRARLAFAALVVVAASLSLALALSFRSNLGRTRTLLRHEAEEARRFRMVAECARDLVRIHHIDGTTEYASPSSFPLLGYRPEELMASRHGALLMPEERPRIQKIVDEALKTRTPPEPYRHVLRRKDGVERLFETRLEFGEDPDGALVRFHTVSRDVTDEVQKDERLSEIASTDELTGLLNRRALIERGQLLLASPDPVAVFFGDVNGLKAVNDALGHATGDELLRDAARALSSVTRDTDLVARIGGDEFVVLARVRDGEGAQAFERRLQARIRAHNAESGRPYRVSMSVGVALRPAGTQKDLESLLAEADAVMYRGKQERRAHTTESGQWIVRRDDEATKT